MSLLGHTEHREHSVGTSRLRTVGRLLERPRKEDDGGEFGGRRLQVEPMLGALAVAATTHVALVALGEVPHNMTAS